MRGCSLTISSGADQCSLRLQTPRQSLLKSKRMIPELTVSVSTTRLTASSGSKPESSRLPAWPCSAGPREPVQGLSLGFLIPLLPSPCSHTCGGPLPQLLSLASGPASAHPTPQPLSRLVKGTTSRNATVTAQHPKFLL